MQSALFFRDVKQIGKALRERRAKKATSGAGMSISAGCARCEHCRAAAAAGETDEPAGLTARDTPSPPMQARFNIVNGLRQWAAGYQPVLTDDEEYCDVAPEDAEHGQIRLSQDVDADARPHDADEGEHQHEEPKGM